MTHQMATHQIEPFQFTTGFCSVYMNQLSQLELLISDCSASITSINETIKDITENKKKAEKILENLKKQADVQKYLTTHLMNAIELNSDKNTTQEQEENIQQTEPEKEKQETMLKRVEEMLGAIEESKAETMETLEAMKKQIEECLKVKERAVNAEERCRVALEETHRDYERQWKSAW